MSAGTDTLEVLVKSITHEAEGINSFELRPLVGCELPPFTAGAHIDLHLADGLVRSYSLVNPQGERHRYVIAVNRDRASRGGSRRVHETLRAGDVLTVGAPRNNFPLVEDAPHSVFIAGGIGITPLWCMIQRLEELGRSWELHYGARARRSAAFLDRLLALGARACSNLHVNFDQETAGRPLDVAGAVASAPPEAHLYCCGPVPMLTAFEAAASGRPPRQVHVEYFAPKEVPAADGGFTVVLARSGRRVAVPAGRTILEALLDEGIDAPHSCTEGVCGTCETTVLEGVPDHRDLVLSQDERASNRTMMICCSGSKSEKLVLDI